MSPGAGWVSRGFSFLTRRSDTWLRNMGLGEGVSRTAARQMLSASVLWDPDWYRRAYPDLGRRASDPLGHFLDRGFALGFNPSPLFWTAWYLARHPQARDYGGGPLVHYLQGRGDAPNPVFDDAWYRRRAPGRIGTALEHYVGAGAAAGLDPHPLFETASYAAAHDLSEAWRGNPLAHFLTEGGRQGASPGRHFDARVYLARYPDVAAAGQNPLVHYLTGGARDLRDPSPRFSTLRHLRRSAGARHDPGNPLVHAVTHEAAGEPPMDVPPIGIQPALTVSAIVPNYNHAPYLAARLDSILGQSVLPDEIIFLDDASRDDSLTVAHAYADRSPVPFRIVANEANSGSVFRQWVTGIEQATGDLVWIAESDDACRPDLIARLKPAFADPSVTLSYGQSRPIAADGLVLADDYRFYTDDLSLGRWRRDYVAEGRDEVIAALSHKNTIPNASAALIRRRAVLDVLPDLPSFRLSGDWRLYLHCAARGRIAFASTVVNEHRRHAGALTLATQADLGLLQEAIGLRLLAIAAFDLTPQQTVASLAGIAAEYAGRAGPDAPPLVRRDDFAAALETVRSVMAERLALPARPRLAVIELPDGAPALPDDVTRVLSAAQPAFLVLVRPMAEIPPWAEAVGPALWLEGAASIASWSGSALWHGHDAAADPIRIAILATLVGLYDVHEIVAYGTEAARLADAIALRAQVARPAP